AQIGDLLHSEAAVLGDQRGGGLAELLGDLVDRSDLLGVRHDSSSRCLRLAPPRETRTPRRRARGGRADPSYLRGPLRRSGGVQSGTRTRRPAVFGGTAVMVRTGRPGRPIAPGAAGLGGSGRGTDVLEHVPGAVG